MTLRPTPKRLATDLSANELKAMSAYDQSCALNEIIAELSELDRMRKGARTFIAEAKKSVLLAADKAAQTQAKVQLIDAQLAFDHIRDRVSTARLQSSILQSLLRVAHL